MEKQAKEREKKQLEMRKWECAGEKSNDGGKNVEAENEPAKFT